MTTTPFDIFNDALELDGDDRLAFVEVAAAGDPLVLREVRSLLDGHDRAQQTSFLHSAPVGQIAATMPRTGTLEVGDRLGPYTILDVLGQGGMGRVYLAEQEHPRRQVALKVVRPGLVNARMLRRFEYEAEVLGMLHHPGIAHIYEAGTADTDGGPQPYFALELVRGETITEFATQHHLTTGERVDIMAKVCDAVHHAHEKGVIHRDLKPANILITNESGTRDGGTASESGLPKILDFGVARAAASDVAMSTLHTDTGQLIGTLQYMSPEQCEGDPRALDTRSDIYSLGVICYELLAGQRPYRLKGRALPEAVRVIHDEDPPTLSSVARECRGDLSTVVGKAMDKERDRRYTSAAAFAADLRRFLNDEPVLARPLGPVARLARWIRRNRKVAGIGAAAIVLIAAATVISGVQIGKRQQAEASRRGDLITMLEQMDEKSPDHAIDAAIVDVNALLADFPDEEIRARTVLGVCLRQKSFYAKAEEQFRIALTRATDLFPQDDPRVATALHNLGTALYWQHRYVDAREQYERAYVLRQLAADGVPNAAVAETINHLAATTMALGEHEKVEALFREALEIREKLGDPMGIAKSKNNLATFLVEFGRYEEAEQLLRSALDIAEAQERRDVLYVARGRHNLGRCLMFQERYSEAWSLLENSRTVKEALGNDPSWARTSAVMAALLNRQARYEEALGYADEALGKTTPRDRADALAVRGLVLVALEREEEAQVVLQEARAIRNDLWQLPEDHPLQAIDDSNLGWCLLRQERFDEAEPLLVNAWETLRVTHGPRQRQIDALERVVELYTAWERPEEAARYESMLDALIGSPSA